MSLSPTTGLSQLSLESMPPTTRSQSELLSSELGGAVVPELREQRSQPDDSEFDIDDPDDSDISHIVRSPFTGLFYDIGRVPTQEQSQGSGSQSSQHTTQRSLDPEQDPQGNIRELFSKKLRYAVPPITLRFCGLNTEDGFYAFQLHESVPFSIRLGKSDSLWSKPTCSCSRARPCAHLIWFFDAIAKLTVSGHDTREPLVVHQDGSLRELGDLFKTVADFRLEQVANSLHCGLGADADVYQVSVDEDRERKTRQILSAFQGFEDEDAGDDWHESDPGHYLSASPAPGSGGGRGDPSQKGLMMPPPRQEKLDLRSTLRQLMHESSEAFSMFVNLLPQQEKVCNPYYRLHDRVNCVLTELHQYSRSLRDSAVAKDRRDRNADYEVTCNVEWATHQIRRAVKQLHGLLTYRGPSPGGQQQPVGSQLSQPAPLETWEKQSAASALVGILHKVVFQFSEDLHHGDNPADRNLYESLINSSGTDTTFVVDSLLLLTDQNQYIEELENIRNHMAKGGANAAYDQRLKEVIARMRKGKSTGNVTGSGSSSSRTSKGSSSTAHPPTAPASAIAASPGSSSSSFLTVPTSGSRGGPGAAVGFDHPKSTSTGATGTTSSPSRAGGGSSGAGSKRPGSSSQEHRAKRTR